MAEWHISLNEYLDMTHEERNNLLMRAIERHERVNEMMNSNRQTQKPVHERSGFEAFYEIAEEHRRAGKIKPYPRKRHGD